MRIFIGYFILILNVVSIIAFLMRYTNAITNPSTVSMAIVLLNIIVSALILTSLHKDKS